ncbi:MAG TPA: hypothetical protein VI643_04115, partial [Planctomycetota bacterium]|nr:hypothetical protein [Planctomycetota bacterium]
GRRPSDEPVESLLPFSRATFDRMLRENRFADALAYVGRAPRADGSARDAHEAVERVVPAARASWDRIVGECRDLCESEGRAAALNAFEAAIRRGYRDPRLRFNIEKAWDEIRGLR